MTVSDDCLTRSVARRRLGAHREGILLRRYARTRDPRLKGQLIERFMPLARSLAWKYRSTGEPIEDLLQVAFEGLVRAVDGYDPDHCVRFSSYATPTILGALRHHLRDGTQAVHLSRGLVERLQKVRTAAEEIGADLADPEAVARLSELSDLTETQVREAIEADASRRPLSVDRDAYRAEEGESVSLAETLGAEDAGFEAVDSSLASRHANLDERERLILRLRFGSSLSQQQVGERLGISQMHVSRLQRCALRKLLEAVQGGDGEYPEALVERKAAA